MDSSRQLQVVITAKDEATRVISGVGSSFGDLVHASTAASFAFGGALALVGKNILDTASDMEQAKVAFTTFLGSSDAASKSLKELSDFAKATPFTFPTVVEAAKRLLAYNVEAKDLIPTLKTLGDLSAGVGTDKLPQLILAFGQVKAATKLTGAELRQFTEAGIPMLQALADELNKNGGALKTFGGAAKKTKVDVGEMNDKLAIATQRLKEAGESGKAKESTLMSLRNTVQNYTQKLEGASDSQATFTKRVKVTTADVKDMISNGEISFDQVQAALTKMTDKGGKFFDLMDKQSQTFSGRMSNISDQLVRVALNIAGISTEANNFGTVVKGGAFDILSNGLQKVLDVLNQVEPKVKGFINAFLQNQGAIGAALGVLTAGLLGAAFALASFLAPLLALMAIGAAVGFVIGFVAQHFEELKPIIFGLSAALAAMAVVILTAIVPAFTAWASAALAAGIGVVAATWPIIAIIAAIGIGVALLTLAWQKNWGDIQGKTAAVVGWLQTYVVPVLISAFEFIKTAIGLLVAYWTFQFNIAKGVVQFIIDIVKMLSEKTGIGFDDIKKGIGMLVSYWVDQFNLVKHSVEAIINTIGNLINKAQELANKVKGGNIKIPGLSFQHGGFVPGAFNQAVPAILHGGERIVPRNGVDVNAGGGGGGITINMNGPVNMDSESRVKELAQTVIDMLGRQNELVAKGIGI